MAETPNGGEIGETAHNAESRSARTQEATIEPEAVLPAASAISKRKPKSVEGLAVGDLFEVFIMLGAYG